MYTWKKGDTDSMDADIVESVVRLTEESEDSAPASADDSPAKTPSKSPDVIVEEEITEAVEKLEIDNPLLVKDEENKESEQEQEGGQDQNEKKKRKKKDRAPKDPKAWKVQAQRSKMTRQSKLAPYFKKNNDPLLGLEHVTEYHDEDPLAPLMYTCSLCEVKLSSENVVQLTQHLTGFRHRLIYLKKHHDELEDPFKDCEIDSFDSLQTLSRPDQMALITKLAQALEEKMGRKYNEIEVFVIVNHDYRQGKQYGGGYPGNYGNKNTGYGRKNVSYGYQHKSKYHPANAHLYGNGAGHLAPESANYGIYSDSFTKSAGTMSFADVLPSLYRCEIINEEDAGLALEASNFINRKILEFNTATSWNRKNQMREHHQHRPHGGHHGNHVSRDIAYDNMLGAGAYSSLVGPQSYAAEGMQAKSRRGALGRGRAHVPYNH